MTNKRAADTAPQPTGAELEFQDGGEGFLTLVIGGRLDSATTAALWPRAVGPVDRQKPQRLTVDASGVDYCDGSGLSLLLRLKTRQEDGGRRFDLTGLRSEFQHLFDTFASSGVDGRQDETRRGPNLAEEVGSAAHRAWQDQKQLITFVGELGAGLVWAVLRPGQVRWKDMLRVAETTGVNALGLVSLIAFLVGLIMSFQAAIPMRQFGAEIFVADLIGLSMLRELGPLMTAIVLAGRSGSAFAAEIGTMTVNEEIDALTTMGLDPVRFLVVPRVLAAVIMTPLLTVFANLVGVLGGAVVLINLGFPLITYFNQLLARVDYGDLLGGLAKSFVFGILIAGVGCLRGLQTGTGASAVGDSTTRAVVSGIVLIVVVDGLFSVAFFYLGI